MKIPAYPEGSVQIFNSEEVKFYEIFLLLL